MKTLVVAATIQEIVPVYKHFCLTEEDFASSKNFDVVVTGVGMMSTAFTLGKLLDTTKYDLILNLGIAGSFNLNEPLGKVFRVTKDSFADFGAEDQENFLTIEEMNFGINTFLSSSSLKPNLPDAIGITVNTISGSTKTIESRKTKWQATTESMEGAAVFYAADKYGIPAMQVRSISNYVTPRNKADWKISLAIENLNKWAIEFLENPTYF